MKTINVRDLQKQIRQCVDLAQREHVVVTRHDRQAAVVIGVEGKDCEDVLPQTNTSFCRMIQDRRAEKTISLAEMRARLRARAPGRKRFHRYGAPLSIPTDCRRDETVSRCHPPARSDQDHIGVAFTNRGGRDL